MRNSYTALGVCLQKDFLSSFDLAMSNFVGLLQQGKRNGKGQG